MADNVLITLKGKNLLIAEIRSSNYPKKKNMFILSVFALTTMNGTTRFLLCMGRKHAKQHFFIY